MKAREFVQFLQKVVQEEVKRQLPGLVKEVLAEQLVRKVIVEAAADASRGVIREVRAQPQTAMGLGRAPVTRSSGADLLGGQSLRGLMRDPEREFGGAFPRDDLSEGTDHRYQGTIFEGTAPLPISAGDLLGKPQGLDVPEVPSATNVNLDVLAQTGIFDYGRMRTIMEESSARPNPRSIIPPSSTKSEAELARYRASLEQIPVDSSWKA